MKPSYGCPRCTKVMDEAGPLRYRCSHCDVVFQYLRAVWEAVERGVS